MSAPETPRTIATAWIITDGKAGDLVQCQGVAEALGLEAEIRTVAPRAPWVWLMPWGPPDPRESPGRPGGPLAGPWPDLAIASGRRTVASLRALKKASGGRTFTVFLKDPRTGPGVADLVWAPEHDRLRGDNVLATLTSPHRLSDTRLAEARREASTLLPPLAAPRVAVLLGGDSLAYRFSAADEDRLVARLASLAGEGASLMATASRRSPPALARAVEQVVRASGGFWWSGEGPNPYAAMLATADAIVVTADSVNMVGEACATGRPVLVFEPAERKRGSAAKIRRFLEGLRQHGAVREFQGHLESYAYVRLNSTPVIAAAITAAFAGPASSRQRPG
ncbi:MAG: mitochondrial fission ELM1 family protein [Alsobacter sp.]